MVRVKKTGKLHGGAVTRNQLNVFEFLMNFRKSGSVLYLSTAEIKEGVSGVLFVDWIRIVDLAVLFLEFFLQLLCIYGELFHLLIFFVHELYVCSGAKGSS